MPKIDEMYANLHGAKIFTTLDLQSGYYHIALRIHESKAKTAFVIPFGKYKFNAVHFGLAQAPPYFQQLISIVLQDCSDFTMAYLDDIIIFSQNEQEHLKHIEIIFKKLKKVGLKLKESKCNFFKKEIHYLGHLISVSGIQPLPKKLDSICNMTKPRSPKEIKQFLGLTGYYRKFIPWTIFWYGKATNKTVTNLCGLISVTFLFRCWKIHCVQHQYWSTLIQASHTHCILMLASMDGQVYSPKVTHPLWMGKKSLWTIPYHMSVVYFGTASQ